jgi:acyl-coenzyme A synthetase/AMP-(fatty) acid ligase
MNTVRPFLRQALFTPNLPALIEGDVTVTYDALRRYCACIAHGLAEAGVKPGDRVALVSTNTMQFVACSIACAWLGAAAASLNYLVSNQASAEEFEATAKSVGVTAAIVRTGANPSALASVSFLPSARVFAVEALSEPIPAGAQPPPVFSDADDLLWSVGFTSGTTGAPKAIGWTHKASLLNSGQMQTMYPSGPGERMLIAMGSGTLFASRYWLRILHCGGCAIFVPTKAGAIMAAISEKQPTQLVTSSYAASVLAELATRTMPGEHRVTPRSLKIIVAGGGKLTGEHQRILRERFASEFIDVYGSSEAGNLARAEPQLQIKAPQYAGRLAQWVDAEAVDEDDHPLPPGTVGRLRFRNLAMAEGYVGDEAATARHFKNGWFYPGDIGMVTAQGLLALRGREDDLINLGGVKVDPVMIEALLNEHPQVLESAVTSASVDGGNRVFAALVVLRDGWTMESVSPELEASCRAKLELIKAPKVFVGVDRLPRNDSGKIVRRALTLRKGKLV